MCSLEPELERYTTAHASLAVSSSSASSAARLCIAGATLFAFLFLWCFVVVLPTNAGGVRHLAPNPHAPNVIQCNTCADMGFGDVADADHGQHARIRVITSIS